jgi:hypothetical protein
MPQNLLEYDIILSEADSLCFHKGFLGLPTPLVKNKNHSI